MIPDPDTHFTIYYFSLNEILYGVTGEWDDAAHIFTQYNKGDVYTTAVVHTYLHVAYIEICSMLRL